MIDPTVDKVRKHFRCNICGCIVFDYYGGIMLIMNGFYDLENTPRSTLGIAAEFSDGQEVDWAKTIGIPYPIQCPGKVQVLANGEPKRIRCKTTYYKIGM